MPGTTREGSPPRATTVPETVTAFVAAFSANEGRATKAVGHTLRHPAAAAQVVRLVRRLPSLAVTFAADACPAAKAELLATVERRVGPVPTGRLAQSVLTIPEAGEDPLSGRRRQALRTNVRHARDDGYEAAPATIAEARAAVDGVLTELGYDQAGFEGVRGMLNRRHVQAWVARDRAGQPVGLAIVTLAGGWARLLINVFRPDVGLQWLLHARLVEGLQEQGCRYLLVDSALALTPGQQHFQSLTGFAPTNLRFDRADTLNAPCTCDAGVIRLP